MFRGGLPAAFAASLATTVLALSSCSLLLDFSASGDAGALDSGSDSDAADTCDVGEPNDDFASATPATGEVVASLCPEGDVDFYGFTLDGASDLTLILTFDDDDGADNLQLALLDGTATVLTVSTTSSNEERIEHSTALANVLPAGTYAVEVYGEGDTVRASYQLDIAIEGPPAPDAGVPDAAI